MRIRPSTWIFWAYLALYIAFQGAVLVASNFYAYLNDFWFLNQLSERFTGTNIAALQDGFFGYLYPLLLKLIPQPVLLPAAAIVSLIAAAAIIALSYFTASRIVGPGWALVAAWIVSMQPDFFSYATVAGGDALAALAVATAIWLLASRAIPKSDGQQFDQPSAWIIFTAALLISVGGTIRYHVLMLASVPLAFALLQPRRRIGLAGMSIAGAAIGFLPQALVNIAAGKGPLFTQQGFNIYRQAVGVDWDTTDKLDPAAYESLFAVLRSHPQEFASGYLMAFANFTLPLLVLALAFVFAYRTHWRPFIGALAIGGTVYAITTALAFSGRTFIALAPPWGIAAAVSMGLAATWLNGLQADDRHPRPALAGLPVGILATAALVWGTLGWVTTNEANAWDRLQLENARRATEEALLQVPGIDSMRQVFTNDFNFYTTRIPDYVPIHNGGLVQVSQPGTDMAKALDGSSVQAFLASGARHGIRAVVWDSESSSDFSQEVVAALRRSPIGLSDLSGESVTMGDDDRPQE